MTPAVRKAVQLLIGLMGPPSSGKTYSALELAAGIQEVTGGDVYVLDSENGRSLFYADRFKFIHVPFSAPFSPLDYLEAYAAIQKRKPAVTITDSMSHEHEGPGGVLEWHETELDRMAGEDDGKRNRLTFMAWSKPKAARRRLINSMLQMDGHFISCFRAKDKKKLPTKEEKSSGEKDVRSLGWMPIAGEEFVYEMAVNFLLPPGARGVPTWKTSSPEQEIFLKVPPVQFQDFLTDPMPGPLSREHGRKMAEWAAGGAPRTAPKTDGPDVGKLMQRLKALGETKGFDNLNTPDKRAHWLSTQLGRKVAKLSEITIEEAVSLEKWIAEME
jgi:hypothetical protein